MIGLAMKAGKVISGGSIVLGTRTARSESLTVTCAGDYILDGVRLCVKEVLAGELRQETGTTLVAMGFPFAIRHWQEGDWMRPLGMKGRRKKLSDIFTDLKFSLHDKDRALVIEGEGSHVLSLLGYRIDESVKAESGMACVRIEIT